MNVDAAIASLISSHPALEKRGISQSAFSCGVRPTKQILLGNRSVIINVVNITKRKLDLLFS